MINKVSSVNFNRAHSMKNVNFGNTPSYRMVNNNPEAFYSLSANRKLNVIFEMLKDVRMNQENAYETITRNQHEMHRSNQHSFLTIIDNDYRKQELIEDTFNRNTVGQIPARPIFNPYNVDSEK